MNAMEELLSNRWIIRAENKERYYRIKDSLGEIRKYANEKLGCQVIANSLLIRLDKIPAKPENYMGIENFKEPMEYCFLCIVLMFLEDKETEEQFVLSQLTEYITANVKEEKVDWTKYTYRRQLIRVLHFCVESGMLRINDGNDDSFAADYSGEVLYENTGVSKYFMRNFSRDIFAFSKPSDFETSDWLEVNEDRGVARRQRVYKRLLMSAGIYRSGEEDEDFEYLKNYGNRINEEMEKNFDCRLQVHKSSAYLIMGSESHIGAAFPENHTLSDIVLLCNHLICEEIRSNRLEIAVDESVRMEQVVFERLILRCKEEYGSGFVKSYRELAGGEFVSRVSEYMEHLAFIEPDWERKEILIRPIIGKIVGQFPKEFLGRSRNPDVGET